ncbi:MAG: stage 0 sporulation family protein [Flavobacteriales bacterium]
MPGRKEKDNMTSAENKVVFSNAGVGEVPLTGKACCNSGCHKLNSFDWLKGISSPGGGVDVVEVRFKNERKEFYTNPDGLQLDSGDLVVVETRRGYDIGEVSLKGELVLWQMKARRVTRGKTAMNKIYRKANEQDIQTWEAARKREHAVLLRSRALAGANDLKMKICDVEFQGDNTKVTIYYTAEERIDFRELIKLYGREFQVRVEMRQIGARQEAGKVGSIGSCGREVCCASWLSDFKSVSTASARAQQLSLNPSKLMGQCGKLKCCLNYELLQYREAMNEFPRNNIKLRTKEGIASLQKTDIFSRVLWYAYEKSPDHFIALALERVLEVIEMNKNGIKPESLKQYALQREVEPDLSFSGGIKEASITRFDKQGNRRRKKKKRKHRKKPR